MDTNLVPHPMILQCRHLLRQMWRALPRRRGPPLHLLLLQVLEDYQLGDEFEAQVRSVAVLLADVHRRSVLLGWHGSFFHGWPYGSRPWCLSCSQTSSCGCVQHCAFVQVAAGKYLFCEAVGEVPGCIDELSWRWSPLPTNMQCRLRAWDFTCLTMDSVQKRLMRV